MLYCFRDMVKMFLLRGRAKFQSNLCKHRFNLSDISDRDKRKREMDSPYIYPFTDKKEFTSRETSARIL